PAPGLRNLADGGPDPAMLPKLKPYLARLDGIPGRYGDAENRAAPVKLAGAGAAQSGGGRSGPGDAAEAEAVSCTARRNSRQIWRRRESRRAGETRGRGGCAIWRRAVRTRRCCRS